MKVKIFEKVIQAGGRGTLDEIEEQINSWLWHNQQIGIIDIRLTSTAATSGLGVANFTVLCLILYNEPEDK